MMPGLDPPGLGFTRPVAADGYRWWYIDALSDDGRFGCTVIAFIGSVFSPFYARARRRGPTDPRDHCCCNVALYGVRGPSWAMTERRRAALTATESHLQIGASGIDWRDGALVITVDERAAPIPRRLRGTITLRPAVRFAQTHVIDGAGRHRWTPIAPIARADLDFAQPDVRWSGHGYLDSNEGDAPLEADFTTWEWSRAILRDGSAAVIYDAQRRDGSRLAFARRFTSDGQKMPIAMPDRVNLPKGIWGMSRTTHSESGARLLRRFEDAPFYTRSMIETQLLGETAAAVHESLSLAKFVAPWVQTLLPFRMRRAR